MAIAKAIPSVSERLRSLAEVVQTGQASYALALAQVTSSLNQLTAKLEDFLTGSFSLTFTPGRSRMLPQGYDPAGQPRRHTPPSPLDASQHQPAVDLGGPLSAAVAVAAAAPGQQEPVHAPSYRLSRQVVTVPDLWREWTVGLGGLPSVATLDATYGSSWRSPSERQYYSMRKVIIDEILALAGNRLDDQEAILAAIEALEQQRIREKASLDKLIKVIKGQRKRGRP